MDLSLIFFLTKMSNVINKKTNLKSKIKDINKKKFNNVSYINNSIRHMSNCMGNNKNRFSKTLSNSSCFKGLSTSAVLFRTLDSYDSIDDLIQQITDPNTSEYTFLDILEETISDAEDFWYIEKNDDIIFTILYGDITQGKQLVKSNDVKIGEALATIKRTDRARVVCINTLSRLNKIESERETREGGRVMVKRGK